ncbi:hypothetical protein BU24DRAFT_465770 [Aaosphaeria arxii CBS 175.79]|uniref:Uncharacterized protein n=1 Tax=Aaosphaeria arxii CBS 175.79 TaxID=1450172 RepID=A0A6A5XH58_9PLEO|nr:uncharacterized protein BU24DRAFT_465770 [Aaosphaeria arxii CBS 175.79]KAF2012209.1 hypothetical protein BU24DRAFT_465770 [Aaosphaeria arxii CBS 175.79]
MVLEQCTRRWQGNLEVVLVNGIRLARGPEPTRRHVEDYPLGDPDWAGREMLVSEFVQRCPESDFDVSDVILREAALDLPSLMLFIEALKANNPNWDCHVNQLPSPQQNRKIAGAGATSSNPNWSKRFLITLGAAGGWLLWMRRGRAEKLFENAAVVAMTCKENGATTAHTGGTV